MISNTSTTQLLVLNTEVSIQLKERAKDLSLVRGHHVSVCQVVREAIDFVLTHNTEYNEEGPCAATQTQEDA